MQYIFYNGELYHHGVQGQKWGVRNAEWYPIDEWKASLKKGTARSDSIKAGEVAAKIDASAYVKNIVLDNLVKKRESGNWRG